MRSPYYLCVSLPNLVIFFVVRALEGKQAINSSQTFDRPTRSRFSVVLLGPRANAELVPKFHVALHASHAALQILTFQKFSP
jgi:hypothetical protein